MTKKTKNSKPYQGKNTQASKTQSHKSQPPKERGFALNLIVVLMILHGIAATIMYMNIRTNATTLDRPWLISMMVIHSVLNIIAAIGIIYWERWALVLYLVSTGLAVVAGLLGMGIWSLFYMILPLAIVGWVLRDKWKYFGIA